MAKWYGMIGFAMNKEGNPGVTIEEIEERPYYGDMVRNIRRLQSVDKLNDDITLQNELSVISDPYILNNFQSIRYATFGESKWKVTSVEVQYPRLKMALGGVYNA